MREAGVSKLPLLPTNRPSDGLRVDSASSAVGTSHRRGGLTRSAVTALVPVLILETIHHPCSLNADAIVIGDATVWADV